MAQDIRSLSLTQLAEKIADKSVSVVECVLASLDAIDQDGAELNAFTSVYPELALAQARRADEELKADGPKSPLHGIPIAVKDLFRVEGMVRTCGSRVHVRELCQTNAKAVQNLKDAGAIVVGLTRLNEFAYGPTGINAVDGSPRNPWNLKHACGGSSSGSACAVASGLVWGAVGSDTGGSVRIPASNSGIAGIKPTYGRVSRQGIYPLASSFDHAGPMARTVADCRVMLQAMAGYDRNDPTTWNQPPLEPVLGRPGVLNGLRIGVPRRLTFSDLHPQTAAHIEAAIAILEAAGGIVEDVELPGAEEALEAWLVMTQAETYAVHETHLQDHYDDLSPDVAVRLTHGADVTTTDYLAARQVRQAFISTMMSVMNHFDVLLNPTTPIPAVELETGSLMVDGIPIAGSMVLGSLTRMANLTGMPATSLPCGLTDDGLPIGLQLTGNWFEEGKLLAIADVLEGCLDWTPGLANRFRQ